MKKTNRRNFLKLMGSAGAFFMMPRKAFSKLPEVNIETANIKGRITCNGEGVAGVGVSDGTEIVQTNAQGYYEFTSDKQNGYVFYILPSGYEPQRKNKYNPLFWQSLTSPNDTSVVEEHNFQLTKVDNDNYLMFVGADAHLANRNNDIKQFTNGFVNRLKQEVKAAGSTPVYSTILGDITWDNYWYANNYGLQDALHTLTSNAFPLLLFPVMGNHDNNGATPATATTDFDAAESFRKTICPNYYSYNLGQIHYVVLDDIFYLNEDTGGSYKKGIVGSRNYYRYIVDYELAWLRKDLALVDKDTPIVIELHIPVWNLGNDYSVKSRLTDKSTDSSVRLCNILYSYKKVFILSGHTHVNYQASPTKYVHIHEINVAAICATWWWTGKLTGRHICKDGSPGGYEVLTVKGKDISWKYNSIEDNGNAQFRVYDTNKVIDFYKNDATVKSMLATYTSRQNYAQYTKNALLVNVFGYDIDWKIEATENGKNLTVKRVTVEDPLHTLAYDVPRFKAAGSYTDDFCTKNNKHMFLIQSTTETGTIQLMVTDPFGNVYRKSVTRPIDFNINMTDRHETVLSGITSQAVANSSKAYARGRSIYLESDMVTMGRIIKVDGTTETIRLKDGRATYHARRTGLYIVHLNGRNFKIFIK